VEAARFATGTALVWRVSDGNFWSGYKYVVEDAAGHECATVTYSHLGNLKRISLATSEYRCRRGIGAKGDRIDVLDATSGDFVAATNLGRNGTITAGSHPTLRLVVKGRHAEGAEMAVVDHHDQAVLTLTWLNADRSARKPFPQGRAVLGGTDLHDDLLVVAACLAFHAFAAAYS